MNICIKYYNISGKTVEFSEFIIHKVSAKFNGVYHYAT